MAEHEQALDIPNVLAAYLQRVIACELPDGSTITETEAIARATLVSFERAMDNVKVAGSKTIGAGQAAAETAEDIASRTSIRLQEAFYTVCTQLQQLTSSI